MKLNDKEINEIIKKRIKARVDSKITDERIVFLIKQTINPMAKKHLEGYLKYIGDKQLLEIIKKQTRNIIDERLTLVEYDD